MFGWLCSSVDKLYSAAHMRISACLGLSQLTQVCNYCVSAVLGSCKCCHVLCMSTLIELTFDVSHKCHPIATCMMIARATFAHEYSLE